MTKKSSALPLLAGGAALLVATSGKKKKKSSGNRPRWGVRISKNCQTVEVVNSNLFNQFLYGAYEELMGVDENLSLIQISDALFGEVAPQCSGFPEQPESAEIAELYAVIARAIAGFLATDPRTKDNMGSLIDEATQISFVDWYRGWRNYPSPDIPEKPSSQVAFSSDLSSYEIGPNWFEETVRPFVQAAYEAGAMDSALEDFAHNRGVLVGKFIMPIVELPQDRESVQAFEGELENAIETAKNEVFTG